ncbi:hypothetical protein [Litchfieldella xinjiangensis]|uniref:hypothetical protein n=1 Tax=Litchfieldella xinjiangensis TaxID=1166948 RepID=UPI0005BA71CB|nr:hypothetical protein [Halomonas xinjiangensis]
MRFQRVRDLVSWVADYHGSLADQYSKFAAINSQDRVRMALEYVADHERMMQKQMQTYLDEDSDHQGILDTWFDDPVDFTQLPPIIERLDEGKCCQSVQQVTDTVLETHKSIQNIYELRADRANVESDTEFFDMVSKDHDNEVKRLITNIQRVEEY